VRHRRSVPTGAKMQRMLVAIVLGRGSLVRLLFRDDLSTYRLDDIRDSALLNAIAPVRSFVDNALAELSHDDLDVIFWASPITSTSSR
jgi:hypothetical protein